MDPSIPGQKGKPPKPVLVSKQEEWEVDKILDVRVRRETTQYLIRWKGFGQAQDLWESDTNLTHVKKKVAAFHHTQDKAVRMVEADLDQQIELLQRDSTLQVVLCGGKAPTRGSELAAGLDLYAYGDHTIPANSRVAIRTGVQIKLPPGTYSRIAS